jgi:hypothetical protein
MRRWLPSLASHCSRTHHLVSANSHYGLQQFSKQLEAFDAINLLVEIFFTNGERDTRVMEASFDNSGRNGPESSAPSNAE